MARKKRKTGKRSRPDVLTPKQRRFVDEWLIDRNGSAAYKRAGYSVRTEQAAMSGASILLRLPKIRALIAELEAELRSRTMLSAENVISEFARVGFSDPRRVFDKQNRLKAVHEWTDDDAAAISSIEIEELFDGHGKDRVQVGWTKKIRFWDKVSALNALAKHLGLLPERMHHSGKVQHEHAHAVFPVHRLPLDLQERLLDHIRESRGIGNASEVQNEVVAAST